MGKFCEYCGKKLEEGETCNCQTDMKEATAYVDNALAGTSYSFISAPFMCANLFPYRGKICSDINVKEEKMEITMSPKRKNKIPTVYFKDIKEVNVSVKISIYNLVIAFVCAIGGFWNPVMFLCALIWAWIAVNRRIRITLNNGAFVDIYSNAKGPAETFASDLGKVLN